MTVNYKIDGAVGVVTLAKPPHNLLALLVFPRKLLDQLDGPRIARSRIAPVSFRSHWFAMDPVGNGFADHLEVLLNEGDVSFPSGEQLSLSYSS